MRRARRGVRGRVASAGSPWQPRERCEQGGLALVAKPHQCNPSCSWGRVDYECHRRKHGAIIPHSQPVAKVADPAWPRRDRARTLNGHGNGQETGGAPGVADVGGHGGPSDERRASLLRAAEPGPGGFRIRCVRRGVVRGFLRGQAGPSESASGSVFPDAVHRLFRGSDVGAGDCVAGGPIR